MLEDLFSHFAKEKKKANATIKEQKARLTLAQRLGQAIRIISTLGRVKVEGVYWFAPKNDLSIPSCEQAKLACVQNVVAAMRNYENIKDKKTKGVKNRWGDGASYYSREELYACAGDIVVSLTACVRNSYTNHHRRILWSMYTPMAGKRRHTTQRSVRHGSRPCIPHSRSALLPSFYF